MLNNNEDVYANKETECFVCKKSVFKVTRITSELVMMKCVNCGEIHMIGAQSNNNNAAPLKFWDSDADPFV